MGMVFGRQTVAEPAYEILYKQSSALLPYEIRRYGQRFAAEVSYNAHKQDDSKSSSSNNGDGDNDTNTDRTPFTILANYIGVFGVPENEGQQAIDMTAPVIKESSSSSPEAVKIAMTAPVIKTTHTTSDATTTTKGMATMAFILPAEFDSMSKIPKPTNPDVQIKEIAPAAGAVHRYSGSQDENLCSKKVQELAEQLRLGGLEEITNEYALKSYQWWGYNPPFTIPMFRRNEIWIELSEDQVKQLVNGGVDSASAN